MKNILITIILIYSYTVVSAISNFLPNKDIKNKLMIIKSVDMASYLLEERDSVKYFEKNMEWTIFDSKYIYLINSDKKTGFQDIEDGSPFIFNNIQIKSLAFDNTCKILPDSEIFNNYLLKNYLQDDLWLSEKNKEYANFKLFHTLSKNRLDFYIDNILVNFPLIPEDKYPVLDTQNSTLVTLEMNYLFKTLIYLWQENKPLALEELMKFFALRKNRWDKDRPYLAPYEQNYEMRNGLKAFKTSQMYQALTNYNISLQDNDINIYFKHLYNGFNEMDFLLKELYSIYSYSCIKPEFISNKRLEYSGYLQCEIFNQLGWLKTNLAKQDLWYILNDKLIMNDSLYQVYLQKALTDPSFNYIKDDAQKLANAYQFNSDKFCKDFYNTMGILCSLTFKEPYQEFGIKPQQKFILNNGKIKCYKPVDHFLIKSKNLTLDLYKKEILKSFNDEISLKWYNLSSLHLYLDGIKTELRDSLTFQFTTCCIYSDEMVLNIKQSGSITYYDKILSIHINPLINYAFDEFYWEKIEELKKKLIQKGISEDWFKQSVNHAQYKTYYNMRRYFISMPEHRVSGNKKNQSWYDQYFGLDQKVVRGKEFLLNYKKVLLKAEQKNGIHYELIMAILSIESDFGNQAFKGTFYTFPALVSQYLTMPNREKFVLGELKSLHDMTKLINKDSYHFIGSFAGAAGWGQFIPSSMKTYFLDSNDDFNDLDIYSIEDNIFSIENYFYKNGLSGKNIGNYDDRYKAVFSYNHSDAYVKAVLKIYDQFRFLREKK